MKKLGSVLLGLTCLFVFCSAVGATTYTFTQTGFTGGETITGWFEGTDLNGDGLVSSFDGEVTSAYFSFSGGTLTSFSRSFSYDDIYNVESFKVVYESGSGILGDLLPDEGMAVGAKGASLGFVYLTGNAYFLTFGYNGGVFLMASGTSTTDQLMQVTESTAAPEPAIVMLLGIGLLGLACVRRFKK